MVSSFNFLPGGSCDWLAQETKANAHIKGRRLSTRPSVFIGSPLSGGDRVKASSYRPGERLPAILQAFADSVDRLHEMAGHVMIPPTRSSIDLIGAISFFAHRPALRTGVDEDHGKMLGASVVQ